MKPASKPRPAASFLQPGEGWLITHFRVLTSPAVTEALEQLQVRTEKRYAPANTAAVMQTTYEVAVKAIADANGIQPQIGNDGEPKPLDESFGDKVALAPPRELLVAARLKELQNQRTPEGFHNALAGVNEAIKEWDATTKAYLTQNPDIPETARLALHDLLKVFKAVQDQQFQAPKRGLLLGDAD